MPQIPAQSLCLIPLPRSSALLFTLQFSYSLSGPAWCSLANTRSFQRHPTLMHPPRHHHKPSPCLIPLPGPGSSYATWFRLKFASKLDTPPPPTPSHTRFGKNVPSSLPKPADSQVHRPCDLLSHSSCWHYGCTDPITPGVTPVASSEFTNSASHCCLSTHTWDKEWDYAER